MAESTNGYTYPQTQFLSPIPVPLQPPIIGGGWRRLLAIIVDMVFLRFVGWALGIFLFTVLVQMGAWGRLVGFGIALLYFGILNSEVGDGKTIGKRIAKIKVINSNGQEISIARSMLRYTIIAIPFFLNGLDIPSQALLFPIQIVLNVAVLGMSLAIIYLIIFNRKTRQSLHDLAVDTYVVRDIPSSTAELPSIWRKHLAIVGVCIAGVLIFEAVIGPIISKKQAFKDLVSTQKAIEGLDNIRSATIFVGETHKFGTSRSQNIKYIQAKAALKARPKNDTKAVNEIASIILDKYPAVMQKDALLVKITYGFDIGIAQKQLWYEGRFTPQDWKKKIDQEQWFPGK